MNTEQMNPNRTIRVLLFAAAKEAIGKPCLEVSFAASSETVSPQEIKQFIANAAPELRPFLTFSRLAQNHAFVEDQMHLEFAANGVLEVALIPPVSGG